jgi:hypothetical protein
VGRTWTFEGINLVGFAANFAQNSGHTANKKLSTLKRPFPFFHIHNLIRPSGKGCRREGDAIRVSKKILKAGNLQ